MAKGVSLIFICLGGVIGWFYLNSTVGSYFGEYEQLSIASEYPSNIRAVQVLKMIENDFLELTELGKLPPEWSQITNVEFRRVSNFTLLLLGRSRPYFSINKSGSKVLEIDFIDIYDNQNPGLIIQASLFDLDSKNKIFEIGRTYSIRQFINERENTREENRGLGSKQRH